MKSLAKLFALLLLASSGNVRSEATAADYLSRSDISRGGGAQGLQWTVDITTAKRGDQAEQRLLRVSANSSSSLGEIIEPLKFKGSKLLQIRNNMWLGRPGLRKAIPISPRQKLTGQAANGDIAATNYSADYDASILREEELNGEGTVLLALKARSKFSTYDRINYRISKATGLGVSAEFLSLSGKLLKRASFEYKNSVSNAGNSVPFVSKMTITDGLSDMVTTLVYKDIKLAALDPGVFDVSTLTK